MKDHHKLHNESERSGNADGLQPFAVDGFQFTHDRESRLIQLDDYSGGYNGSEYYVYDSTGRLLMKTAMDGTKTKYYYDGINTLLTKEKPNGGSCWRTKTTYALKNASIGQVVMARNYTYSGSSCTTPSITDRWYHYDHIGNVVALTDENGAITDSFDMDAFGTVKSGDKSGLHLTTKEYDAANGLYYFGARWYDRNMGRWMEEDPTGLDGVNLYILAYNSPVFYFDSNGLSTANLGVGISGGIMGGYGNMAAGMVIDGNYHIGFYCNWGAGGGFSAPGFTGVSVEMGIGNGKSVNDFGGTGVSIGASGGGGIMFGVEGSSSNSSDNIGISIGAGEGASMHATTGGTSVFDFSQWTQCQCEKFWDWYYSK